MSNNTIILVLRGPKTLDLIKCIQAVIAPAGNMNCGLQNYSQSSKLARNDRQSNYHSITRRSKDVIRFKCSKFKLPSQKINY